MVKSKVPTKKRSKLLWIVTTFWIITLIVLVLDFTTPIFKPKPKFHCTKSVVCGGLFEYLITNCIDSVLIGETPEMSTTMDITNEINICHVTWYVDEAISSAYKGTSMVCDIPMEKILNKDYNSTGILAYCEGPLKDISIQSNTTTSV